MTPILPLLLLLLHTCPLYLSEESPWNNPWIKPSPNCPNCSIDSGGDDATDWVLYIPEHGETDKDTIVAMVDYDVKEKLTIQCETPAEKGLISETIVEQTKVQVFGELDYDDDTQDLELVYRFMLKTDWSECNKD